MYIVMFWGSNLKISLEMVSGNGGLTWIDRRRSATENMRLFRRNISFDELLGFAERMWCSRCSPRFSEKDTYPLVN